MPHEIGVLWFIYQSDCKKLNLQLKKNESSHLATYEHHHSGLNINNIDLCQGGYVLVCLFVCQLVVIHKDYWADYPGKYPLILGADLDQGVSPFIYFLQQLWQRDFSKFLVDFSETNIKSDMFRRVISSGCNLAATHFTCAYWQL